MRRGYSIFNIYKHALKPYIKLPNHTPKYQALRKEETFSKQVKRTLSQYRQYLMSLLNVFYICLALDSSNWITICLDSSSRILESCPVSFLLVGDFEQVYAQCVKSAAKHYFAVLVCSSFS